MDESSEPRSILITGANGVLGLALAHCFVRRDPGAHVYLGVRSGREKAEAFAVAHPGRSSVLDLDVTKAEHWTHVLEVIQERGVPLKVLVNNAGYHDDSLLANMSAGQWHGVIDTNLHGVWLGCQAVLKPLMQSRGGRIVNVVSLSASHPPAGQTNYAAAKAGVVGLTKCLAKEVARMGITVNGVAPAHIEGATPAGWTDEQLKAARMQTPMRRFAKPEEVAAAVFFLASADASYINGTVLQMDGGLA